MRSILDYLDRRINQWSDKSGIITTAHGLRIACLGGIYDPGIYSSAEVAPVGMFLLLRYSTLMFPDLPVGISLTLLLQTYNGAFIIQHIDEVHYKTKL